LVDHWTVLPAELALLANKTGATRLGLHLLQACLVFVNVLMLQVVLAEPPWAERMTPEDYRGLTPLVFAHVTPYGRFELNLDTRIPIDPAA
jgi:hypothetical protein